MSQGRSGRRTPGSAVAARARRGALAGLLAGALLVGGAGPALAAPAPPVNPSDEQIADAQGAQDAAAAEVGRLQAELAVAQTELERLALQAEAAGTAYLAAEEALGLAQAAADQAAADLEVATGAVDAALGRIAGFAHDSYVNGATLTTAAALLDSAGPGELVQRAAMLEYVGDTQVDVLDQLEVARVQQANAESTARQTRDEMAAAEDAAAAAKDAADAQVAQQQGAVEAATAHKADLDCQLQAAQIQLLELQGARDAYQAWVAQKAAEEAAARAAEERARSEAAADVAADSSSSGYARPAAGRTSSCYGARWGVTHYGVDIAAPIGTPVYAATAGVVQRAGSATGFGLAVYIRGNDGAVTVYGHVNRYFVTAGERVAVGEEIAEVGNRGQSTGPHLHFEVHPSGAMYGGQVDPVPWLRSRGINIRGC